MAVDLGDYIDNLKREVSAPGNQSTDFPNATDNDWIGNLADAFWEARLDGLLAGFTCDANGSITPIAPAGISPSTLPDIGRDMVQLVILYASFRVVRNALRGLRTQFRAAAGPVSFEYQQSANLLVELMKDIINRRDIILTRLSDLGSAPDYVIDAIQARDLSLSNQLTYWTASGALVPDPYGSEAY